MSSTLNKIMLVTLILSALALAGTLAAYHAQKKQLRELTRQNGEYRLALSGVEHQTRADALADSLAFPRLSVTIPPATVLRSNRKLIKPLRGEFDPIAKALPPPDRADTEPTKPPDDLPTAVILHYGEVVPYDSAVVIEYNQYYYTERARARSRTVEITTSARLPDVVLPDFIPTRKEVRRGKWRAFAGGLAVGAVAALALPLVLTR